MAKGEKPIVKRVVTTTHSEVTIREEQRRGLLSTTTSRYVSSRDGVEGQWDALWALASEPRNPKPKRTTLFEQLEQIELHAQSIARQEGCERKSTLDVIEKVERVDGVVVSEELGVVGNYAENGSLLRSAYLLERQTRDVREQIKEYEKLSTSKADQELFYDVMSNAIRIARQMMLITIQRHEKSILRGQDDSFGGKGATKSTQREGVKRVQQLMKGDKPLKKTAAVKQVAKEYGTGKSAVFRWFKEHSK